MTDYTPMTQEEYDEAVSRWKEENRTRPRAVAFSYNPHTHEAHLELSNHPPITFPINMLRGFENATSQQIKNVRLVADGADIWWDDLDVQATVEYIVSHTAALGTMRSVVNG